MRLAARRHAVLGWLMFVGANAACDGRLIYGSLRADEPDTPPPDEENSSQSRWNDGGHDELGPSKTGEPEGDAGPDLDSSAMLADAHAEFDMDSGDAASAHDGSMEASEPRVQTCVVDGLVRAIPSVDLACTEQGDPRFSRSICVCDDATVHPSCTCSPVSDVPALIAQASLENDNARVGLDVDDGLSATHAVRTRSLPCGRYYVTQMYAAHPVILEIEGAVELFVAGSLISEPTGGFEVRLGEGSSLDVYVGSGISAQGSTSFGVQAEAWRTRIHASGENTLYFAGQTSISAIVHAPSCNLTAEGSFELVGALVVHTAWFAQAPLVQHDAVLESCPIY